MLRLPARPSGVSQAKFTRFAKTPLHGWCSPPHSKPDPHDGLFSPYRPVQWSSKGNFSPFDPVCSIMKFLCIGSATMLCFATCVGIAQTSGTCAAPFEAPLKSGAALSIDSRSAEIQIVGTDQEAIRVSCTIKQPEQAKEIVFQFSEGKTSSKLRLKGGPTNNVRIRIEVPRTTSLTIHAPAGVLGVDGVTGDKDMELHAGEITVSHVDGAEYKSVEASVGVGEVRASAFGIEKGGFLRKFTKENAGGKYRLHARVGSGSIQLN